LSICIITSPLETQKIKALREDTAYLQYLILEMLAFSLDLRKIKCSEHNMGIWRGECGYKELVELYFDWKLDGISG
jgi:hypothetical protein